MHPIVGRPRREWIVPEGISLPPNDVRNHDDDEYVPSAKWNIRTLDDFVPVDPNWRILEIGCAAGRLAMPLLDFLVDGTYEGIDINRDAIAWAQKNITSHWPNVTFRHVDIAHARSNPHGKIDVETVSFGLAPRHYDLVMLHSVFTHLLAIPFTHYVKQISRAIKLGGYLYFTAFLWDERAGLANRSTDGGTLAWPFDYDLGNVLVIDPEMPDFAVAVRESFAQATLDGHGFELVVDQRGPWREGAKGGQDILVYRRRPELVRPN